MALKAEAPPLVDYIEVSSSVLRFKEKGKVAADPLRPARVPPKRDRAQADLMAKGEGLVPSVVPRAGQEELDDTWMQEYLIGRSGGCRRLVCMVCGGSLSTPGSAAARKHILRHHAHSLDFSLEEKRNILEAWSEGAVLPTVEPPPSPKGSPDKSQRPAEIEVLLDSEEQPSGRKRGHPKARSEAVRSDTEWRSQDRLRQQSSGSAKDTKSREPSKVAGKEWLSECGVTGSAPAEIRIFTDGTFPAGFALKLYCRTQPEPPQDSGAKPDARKPTVGGCSKGRPTALGGPRAPVEKQPGGPSVTALIEASHGGRTAIFGDYSSCPVAPLQNLRPLPDLPGGAGAEHQTFWQTERNIRPGFSATVLVKIARARNAPRGDSSEAGGGCPVQSCKRVADSRRGPSVEGWCSRTQPGAQRTASAVLESAACFQGRPPGLEDPIFQISCKSLE